MTHVIDVFLEDEVDAKFCVRSFFLSNEQLQKDKPEIARWNRSGKTRKTITMGPRRVGDGKRKSREENRSGS